MFTAPTPPTLNCNPISGPKRLCNVASMLCCKAEVKEVENTIPTVRPGGPPLRFVQRWGEMQTTPPAPPLFLGANASAPASQILASPPAPHAKDRPFLVRRSTDGRARA